MSARRLLAAVRRRLPADDGGSAPLELVVVFPVVAFTILALFQASMWFFAREIAENAAQLGAQTGSTYPMTYPQTASSAVDQTNAYITETGNSTLLSPVVSSAGSTAQETQITIQGHCPSLVPFWAGPTVSVTVVVPVEQLTSGDSW